MTHAATTTLDARTLGRPEKPIDPARVRDLAALGLSSEMIATRIGVARRTLFDRMERDPEIRQAFDEGLAEGVEFAARGLQALIAQGNLGALIFYLKSRGGFKDPPSNAPSVVINIGEQKAPVTIESVNDLIEEQRALIEGHSMA